MDQISEAISKLVVLGIVDAKSLTSSATKLGMTTCFSYGVLYSKYPSVDLEA